MKSVKQNPAAPAHRLVGKREREKKITGNARVRYLYAREKRRTIPDAVLRTLYGLLKLV